MAQYKITSSNSIYTTSGVGIVDAGFFGPFPNTLVVDASGFVISTANNALELGQSLPTAKTWAITVNGVVASTAVASSGIYMATPGWNSVAPSVTLTVGVEGEVWGAYGFVSNQKATITNKGSITATDGANGVSVLITEDADGDSKITNYGRIGDGFGKYGIQFRNDVTGIHTIINTGVVAGLEGSIVADPASLGVEKVTNSGYLTGLVRLGGGADELRNSGTIWDDVSMGSGTPDNDILSNSGRMYGAAIFLGGGADIVTNSGTIDGELIFADGGDSVTNSGTIGVGFAFGNSASKLTNSGTISGNVTFGSGNDAVVNTGTMLVAILGDGADSYAGGSNTDTVWDGDGLDTIMLGAGDDFYRATGSTGADGDDLIDGGTGGNDTYFAGAASNALHINLDSVVHDLPSPIPGAGFNSIAANTATGVDVAFGAGKDTIKGFENAVGGLQTDIIYGSASANQLQGGGSADYLMGFAGNDTLRGDDGFDWLVGGLGRDTLWGGTQGDAFMFLSIKDSGITKATRDTIMDFEDGVDVIGLSAIDANTVNGTVDDAFTFIGANKSFTGVAGELRTYMNLEGWIVEGDVNGDKKADLSIQVTDKNHIIFWSVGGIDFAL